ncbi:MAG: hypothetical protein ACKOW8_03285, partial [Flavobacteriales bacterium]
MSLLLLSFEIFAQRRTDKGDAGYVVASHFAITKPLTEIAKEFPVDENTIVPREEEEESEDRKHRKAQKFKFSVTDDPIKYGNDPVSMQRELGDVPSGGLKLNIPGQSAAGFRPYDPSGAVGPNHY